ncbi:MAG: sulfatase-like hydrolase/transferase [Cyclobacteriaceae bacterium]|nr:sulfatase-like hydrolase/transferase [Cyclobacteriaceae bacterium]
MTRSMSLKHLTAYFSMLLIAGCSTAPEESPEPLKNVIVIIGDDHASHVMGALGNDLVRTPNLDRLAGEGILFSNAFANSPLCSASRQSLLTGKYPHATGVTLLTTSFPEEQVTVADHLSNYGFSTAIIGKNHFNNNLNHGFDLKIERSDYFKFLENNPPRPVPDSVKVRPPWKPFNDHARIWLNSETLPSEYYDEDDIGTWYAAQAVEFIQNNRDNRFCLWLGFHEPHSPFNFPVEYYGSYDPDRMPLPEGSPEDDEYIPLVFSDLTDVEKKGIIAAYYTSVEYLDKNIGLVLDGLNDAGLSGETLVIYLGDHGYLLNHHKRFEKHMMWEEAVRAPLIIRAGNRETMENREEKMVEFIDVAPTIMDFLGVPPLTQAQGKSLRPFYDQEIPLYKEMVFSEFLADNKAMVRTDRWKYIFTSGNHDLAQGYATGNDPAGIRHRLYDLINDPDETTDVSGNHAYQQEMESLQFGMLEIFKSTHPGAGDLPEGLSVEEQLVWFCEPPDANPELEAK